jgi:hypothetical protein
VFDTLSYARKLQDAGFTESQARAQAEALAEIASENLATKSDIASLETGLRRDMKEMETRLRLEIESIRRDMKEMETRLQAEIAAMSDKLTIRLGGMLVVGITMLGLLIKLL